MDINNRSLLDFNDSLEKLKSNGYYPIAVAQMCFEDTFVFNTEEEAESAYNRFERDVEDQWIGEIVGWWYGRDKFIEEVENYEKKLNEKVNIHWLV